MIHYSLNSGHSRVSPRSEVADDIIELLAPLLKSGEHDLPIEGYSLKTTTEGRAFLATVHRHGVPLATIGVACDDDSAEIAWPALERLYLALGDLPGFRSLDFSLSRRPKTTPWCAVAMIALAPEEANWVGDFERCLAWAWIENT